MRKFLVAAVVALAGLSTTATPPASAHARTGCRTHACLVRVCKSQTCKARVWRKSHRAEVSNYSGGMDSFTRCVLMHESTGDFHNRSAYRGGFQFDYATWAAATRAMGVSAPYDPADASPALQIAVFHYWYARHPSAWPVTGPACGGVRSGV